ASLKDVVFASLAIPVNQLLIPSLFLVCG
ncbi:hypothetical protein D039_4403B, partial [Vibrio parahaemolyticus EKP-028]